MIPTEIFQKRKEENRSTHDRVQSRTFSFFPPPEFVSDPLDDIKNYPAFTSLPHYYASIEIIILKNSATHSVTLIESNKVCIYEPHAV